MFKVLLLILGVGTIATWAYLLGTFQPAVVYMPVLPQLYEDYLIFEMEEDGSYKGITKAGVKVTGCIDNAICKNE